MVNSAVAVGVSVAALAAARFVAYAGTHPTSQIFGHTITAGLDPLEFALTYDDGPNDPDTQQLLDLLAEFNVKATFFLIGSFVRQRPDIAQAIDRAGHLIGNHTYTHRMLITAPPSAVKKELSDCNAAIADAIGHLPTVFRPPFGARRPDVLKEARNQGLAPVLWNVTCYDWRPNITAQQIFAYAQRGISRNQSRTTGIRGSNFLLHDGGQAGIGQNRKASIAATRMILETYAAKARFVTADHWLQLPHSKPLPQQQAS